MPVWGGGRRAPRSPHRVGRRLDRVRRFPVGSLSRGSPPRLRRRVGLGGGGGPTHGADDARAVRIYPAAADVRVAAAARARRRRRRRPRRGHGPSRARRLARMRLRHGAPRRRRRQRLGPRGSRRRRRVHRRRRVRVPRRFTRRRRRALRGRGRVDADAGGRRGGAPLRRRSPLRRPRLPNRRIRGGRRRAHPSRRPSATGVRHRRPRRARRDVRARRRSTGRGDRVDGDCHPGSRRGIRRRRDGSIAFRLRLHPGRGVCVPGTLRGFLGVAVRGGRRGGREGDALRAHRLIARGWRVGRAAGARRRRDPVQPSRRGGSTKAGGWFLRADHPGRVGGVHERGRSLERGPGAAAAAGAPDEGVGGVGEPRVGGARRIRVPPRRRRREFSPRRNLGSTRRVFVSRAGYAHGAGGVLDAAPRRSVRKPPPRHASTGGGRLRRRRGIRREFLVLRRCPRRLSPFAVDVGGVARHRRGGRRDPGAGHRVGLS
mmetsp:Transcript_12233/g.51457  ORF Transcript_12233/g.51457 Transcript_12233/m.51457 type:complete len:487 (-) Transcript_12233:4920-6380(-)